MIKRWLSQYLAKSTVKKLLKDAPEGVALETFFQDELRLVESPKNRDIDPIPVKDFPGIGLDENGELRFAARYQGHVPGMDGKFLKQAALPKWIDWDVFIDEVTRIVGTPSEGFERYTSGVIWYI